MESQAASINLQPNRNYTTTRFSGRRTTSDNKHHGEPEQALARYVTHERVIDCNEYAP